jgi:hypothetical protein
LRRQRVDGDGGDAVRAALGRHEQRGSSALDVEREPGCDATRCTAPPGTGRQSASCGALSTLW